MGWFYPYGASRRSLIAELTQTEDAKKADGTVVGRRETIRHCFRGGCFSGILWTIEQITRCDGQEPQQSRWITAYFMEYRNGEYPGWGYKPVEESMGPYAFSCPLSYLEAVPEGNREWRTAVRQYHERQLAKRREKKSRSTGILTNAAGPSGSGAA